MNSKEDPVLSRSRDKLKRDVEQNVLRSADAILDIAEVAIGDPHRYKSFRSKVLRASNDAVRQIKKDIDMNYQILFVPSAEDIIEINSPTVTGPSVIGN